MAPLTIHDRLKIKELFARYAWTGDTGDVDGFAALFTPGATIEEQSGRHAPADFAAHLRGRAQLAGCQHWIGHSQVRGDSSRCHVRSFGMATHLHDTGATAITWLGYYDDVLVAHDGGWLFERRTIRPWRGDVLARFPDYRRTSPDER